MDDQEARPENQQAHQEGRRHLGAGRILRRPDPQARDHDGLRLRHCDTRGRHLRGQGQRGLERPGRGSSQGSEYTSRTTKLSSHLTTAWILYCPNLANGYSDWGAHDDVRARGSHRLRSTVLRAIGHSDR